MQDLKEIQDLIEIADIRAKPSKSKLKEDSLFEADLPFEATEFGQDKWYMRTIREGNAGAITIHR